MADLMGSRPTTAPDQKTTGRNRPERLMGPDSLFEPTLSIVISDGGSRDDLESTIGEVNRILEQRPTTGELIVVGSAADRPPESGVIVIDSEHDDVTGLELALESARGDHIVLITESHRYNVADFIGLLNELESGDSLVVGSRVTDSGLPPLEQHLGIPMLSTVLRWRYGVRLSDPVSGFTAFKRSLLTGIDLSELEPPVTLELIRAATASNLPIGQVAVSYRSALNRDDATPNLAYLRQSLTALPPDVLTIPGGGSVLIGLALLTAVVMGIPVGDVGGPLSHPFRTTLLGGLLAIAGTQLVGLGVFAQLRLTPDGRRGHRFTEHVVQSITNRWALGLGMAVLSVGLVYGLYLLNIWLEVGISAQPAYSADLLAVVLLVLGGQLAAGSIFLHSLTQRNRLDREP